MRSSTTEDVSSPLEMHIPTRDTASPAGNRAAHERDVGASPKSWTCNTAVLISRVDVQFY
jgi:hypothetical protein